MAIILVYGIVIMFAFTKIFASLIENNGILYIYFGLSLSVIASKVFKGRWEENHLE